MFITMKATESKLTLIVRITSELLSDRMAQTLIVKQDILRVLN